MTVLEKILNLLDSQNLEYKKIEHAPVYTSEQAAVIRDSNLSLGAKAIVCFANKNPILIVVPGDMKIDFKQFKHQFGFKDLRMATHQEVLEITGLEIGSIPPIGSVMNLQSYYDEIFNTKEDSVFNAGSHVVSIRLKTSTLLALEKPIIGKFAILK